MVYKPDAPQLLRFPRIVDGNRLVVLLTSPDQDQLLEVELAGGEARSIYKTSRGAIRWLDSNRDGQQLLLVKTDGTGQFVLFEISLDQQSIQLVGNNDSIQSASYNPDDSGVLFRRFVTSVHTYCFNGMPMATSGYVP